MDPHHFHQTRHQAAVSPPSQTRPASEHEHSRMCFQVFSFTSLSPAAHSFKHTLHRDLAAEWPVLLSGGSDVQPQLGGVSIDKGSGHNCDC